MKPITRFFSAIGAGLKAATMRWTGQARYWWQYLLPRTKFDYGKEVGDGSGSNVVMACVLWMARTFPEAPVHVVEIGDDGERVPVVRHPLALRIERPNAYYAGPLLWFATLIDWATTGNAYWLKVRDRTGEVVELWWAPSWSIEPKWPEDGSQFISHYEYGPDPSREPGRWDTKDVVHFRYGLDPNNTRKGMSPLRSLLREIFTDDEAANFTASLMRNLGVPGLVISPEAVQAGGSVSDEDAAQIKDTADQKFRGDKRGETMVMTRPTKVTTLSFSPEQMLLRDLRRVPEERVSAILGVAAVVVGLGAGLDRSTFANFGEAREAAYEGNIIPSQRLIGADLTVQLLPDFEQSEEALMRREVGFNLKHVRVLQPDMDKLFERHDRAIRGGWERVSEGKRAVGLPVGTDDDVYLRPFTVVPVGNGAEPSPMPKMLGTKAEADEHPFARQMALARARIAERFEPELRRFFAAQAERVDERLNAIVNLRSGNGASYKTPAVGAGALLPGEEDERLARALTPLWLTAVEAGWVGAAGAFGLEAAFDAESAAVAAVLGEAGHRAGRINDGTRSAITRAFEEGAQQGRTLEQIIAGVPADDVPGLHEVVEASYANRPSTAALTEAMWGTNMGALGAYRANGVSRVLMVDGGTDPPCAARNGQVVSVSGGQSATNHEHPSGTLTLIPA